MLPRLHCQAALLIAFNFHLASGFVIVAQPPPIIPACLPQAGWNDGGGCGWDFFGMAKGLSGWQLGCSLLVVIPAQAGIQEGGGAVVNG